MSLGWLQMAWHVCGTTCSWLGLDRQEGVVAVVAWLTWLKLPETLGVVATALGPLGEAGAAAAAHGRIGGRPFLFAGVLAADTCASMAKRLAIASSCCLGTPSGAGPLTGGGTPLFGAKACSNPAVGSAGTAGT